MLQDGLTVIGGLTKICRKKLTNGGANCYYGVQE